MEDLVSARPLGPLPRDPVPSERTSVRRMGRDTMIYGIGMVLSRAVGFIMLPVYTRYLTTADYGVLQLLDMTTDISYVIFMAGMTAGVSLFYFQTTDESERNDIVRTAFVLEMILTSLGAGLLLALSPWLRDLALGGAGQVLFVRIAAINFALQMMSAIPMVLLQIRQRPQAVIAINLARLVGQLSLNILFVVVLEKGVLGILLSSMIVNGIQGTASAVWLIRTAPGRARMAIVHRLRRYGWPLQISAVGGFLLSFGDRFFLQASRGVSAVGLYALAYQFGFLLHQLSTEQVLKAWTPQRMQLLNEPKSVRDTRYNQGFFYFNLVLITMATGIGLFVQPVIRVMTTAPFHPAARLVPVILAAYVIQSWGEATSFGISVSQRTKFFTYATWASVAVVLVLYALLIPPFGGMGAAVGTLGAFVVRFGLLYFWSQQLWPVDYSWRPILRLTAYGAAAVVVAFAVPDIGIADQAMLSGALLGTYMALIWITIFDADHRAMFGRVLRSPRQLPLLFRTGS